MCNGPRVDQRAGTMSSAECPDEHPEHCCGNHDESSLDTSHSLERQGKREDWLTLNGICSLSGGIKSHGANNLSFLRFMTVKKVDED